jgi:PPM family protein phosphatase
VHGGVHVVAVFEHLGDGGSRDVAALRTAVPLAGLHVIGVEQERVVRVVRAVARRVRHEDERLEEPRGVCQVPLRGAHVGHALHDVVLGGERRAGMGGHVDGGVASHLAVAALAEGFRPEGESLEDRLREAVAAANAAVWEEANRGGLPRRMGTTCTVLAVEGGRAALAHVGDSRAYRVVGGALEQLTPDHTVAAELEASGVLSAAEAARHPQRHALTRALGVGPEVEVYTRDLGPAAPGDYYLLCSDGLAPVPPEEVARTVAGADPQEAAARLVARANALGGPDNITALVVRIGG